MSERTFFVSRARGRAPEGPFDEGQIVALILAGKLLGSALVCGEGKLRFVPLPSHPPFAQALGQAKRTASPLAVGSAPIKRKPAPPPQQKGRGALIGAVLAFFGMAIGAVGIGAYLMFNNGGTPAHAAVPSNTELLFEVGSLHGVAQNLGAVRCLDSKLGGSAKLLDDASADLSARFEISKAQANALVLAASSVGFAARNLGSAPEGGLVLTFSTATPVNTFLASKHFKYAGLVSTNGRVYTSRESGAGSAVVVSRPLRALSALTLASQSNELVWFETSKVLYLGAPSFALGVARSLSLEAPSLAKNPRFQRAQRAFLGQADAIAYLDPAVLTAANAPRLTALFGDELTKAEPLAASLELVPAGLLAHVVVRLPAAATAPAASVGATVSPAPAQPLTVIDRLPSETFAYVAGLTKTQLMGAALGQRLLEQVKKSDPGADQQATGALASAQMLLQLHVDDVLGALGDQSALALLAPAEYPAAPAQLAGKFAALYLQTLKDDAPAPALLGQLRTQLERLAGVAQVREDVAGYTISPSERSFGAAAQLRFTKGYVGIAVGSAALVERSMQAVTAGEGTLNSDPAQQAARAALPSNAQVFAWLDAGRIMSRVLQHPLPSPLLHDFGWDSGIVRWTGPDRATVALAFSRELGATYRVDTLNLPALPGFFGGAL